MRREREAKVLNSRRSTAPRVFARYAKRVLFFYTDHPVGGRSHDKVLAHVQKHVILATSISYMQFSNVIFKMLDLLGTLRQSFQDFGS